MNIDDLTVKQARELAQLFAPKRAKPKDDFPFGPGDKIFIRTVTHHMTGRVVGIGRDWIKLEEAAWIADDGRFHDMLMKGTISEVEPCPDFMVVGRGAIIDIMPWRHELPKVQK